MLILMGIKISPKHFSLYNFTTKGYNYQGKYFQRGIYMNIQIYGKPKCFDTKKAERYFKERRIKVQMIDISKYPMSQGEFRNIKAALKMSLDEMIDDKSKLYESLFIKYLANESDKEEKIFENQAIFKTPIVRNGKQATIGYQPEVWKNWE